MKKRNSGGDGLVYSTRHGKMCPDCSRPLQDCRCARGKVARSVSGPAVQTPNDGIVRVGRSTKGRKGKGVTTVTGVPVSGEELRELARELKQKCGSGGGLQGDVIEIQGDHRDVLVAELSKRGWKVKKAGG